jgi:hypothetical protein
MSRLQRTKQKKKPYKGWPSSSQFKPWNVCVKPTCWSKMAAWTSHGNCELWWPMEKTFEEDYSYLWYDDLWRIHNLGWNMPTKLGKLLSHWIISEETCTDTKPWKHYPNPFNFEIHFTCQYLSSWKSQLDLALELGIYPSKSYNGQPTFK